MSSLLINSLHAVKFFTMFCRLIIFFKINFFEKIFQEYLQCQPIWLQIRPDILSGLIWVQTVSKDYQQTTIQQVKS